MYYTYNSLWWFFWVVPVALLIVGVLMWSARRAPDLPRLRYGGRELDPQDTNGQRQRERARKSLLGRGPRNYRCPDARILEDVSDRLWLSEDLDASDIEVHVVDGVVQLEGSVSTRFDERMAEALADAVAGVIDVNNRLAIGAPALRTAAATSDSLPHPSLQGEHPMPDGA